MAIDTKTSAIAFGARPESRFDTRTEIALDGEWNLHPLVQWGPYKTWSFHYRLNHSCLRQGPRAEVPLFSGSTCVILPVISILPVASAVAFS
ncbi:hypothetical protein [Lamprobacter sp.]|uniref:hypothetical protein n=1 Tax=Lamprobacter sp. TaxID=3100796 RepID=UPI002B26278C|nr:hypothetical protein [Lamprobacter sp.]